MQPDLPLDFDIAEIPPDRAAALLDQMIAITALWANSKGDIADVMAAFNHYCRLIRPHLAPRDPRPAPPEVTP